MLIRWFCSIKMHSMNYLNSLLAAFMLVAFVGSPFGVNAQEGEDKQELKMNQQSESESDISDKELENFASVSMAMRKVKQEQIPKMKKAVKAEGLTMKEYQQLKQRLMGKGQKKNANRKNGEDGTLSKEEKEQFRKAKEAIKPIRENTMERQKATITESNLSEQRYKEIYQAVRSSQSLQKRLKSLQQGGSDK